MRVVNNLSELSRSDLNTMAKNVSIYLEEEASKPRVRQMLKINDSTKGLSQLNLEKLVNRIWYRIKKLNHD